MITELVAAWVRIITGAILTVALTGGLISAAVAALVWRLYGPHRAPEPPQDPDQQYAPVRPLTKEKQPA